MSQGSLESHFQHHLLSTLKYINKNEAKIGRACLKKYIFKQIMDFSAQTLHLAEEINSEKYYKLPLPKPFPVTHRSHVPFSVTPTASNSTI